MPLAPELAVYRDLPNDEIPDLVNTWWAVFSGSKWKEGGINPETGEQISMADFSPKLLEENFELRKQFVEMLAKLTPEEFKQVTDKAREASGFGPFYTPSKLMDRFTANLQATEKRKPITIFTKNEKGEIACFSTAMVLTDTEEVFPLIASADYLNGLPQATQTIRGVMNSMKDDGSLSLPVLYQDEAGGDDTHLDDWPWVLAKSQQLAVEEGCEQALFITDPREPYYISVKKRGYVLNEVELGHNLWFVVIDVVRSSASLQQKLFPEKE